MLIVIDGWWKKDMLLPLRHFSHDLHPLGHGPTHLPAQRRTKRQRIAIQHRILHSGHSVVHSPETGRYRSIGSHIESNTAVYRFPLDTCRIDRSDYFRMCDYFVCAMFADESALDAKYT